jgi:hypothetical protein
MSGIQFSKNENLNFYWISNDKIYLKFNFSCTLGLKNYEATSIQSYSLSLSTIPRMCTNFHKLIFLIWLNSQYSKFLHQKSKYHETLVHPYISRAFKQHQEHQGALWVGRSQCDKQQTNNRPSLINSFCSQSSNVGAGPTSDMHIRTSNVSRLKRTCLEIHIKLCEVFI